ncbi:hypothetical protein TNCV_1822501 [Trichonephila clavipes]|nr:hypothetical protein TNCV_1822501 [Trichonephila clavipes]
MSSSAIIGAVYTLSLPTAMNSSDDTTRQSDTAGDVHKSIKGNRSALPQSFELSSPLRDMEKFYELVDMHRIGRRKCTRSFHHQRYPQRDALDYRMFSNLHQRDKHYSEILLRQQRRLVHICQLGVRKTVPYSSVGDGSSNDYGNAGADAPIQSTEGHKVCPIIPRTRCIFPAAHYPKFHIKSRQKQHRPPFYGHGHLDTVTKKL